MLHRVTTMKENKNVNLTRVNNLLFSGDMIFVVQKLREAMFNNIKLELPQNLSTLVK